MIRACTASVISMNATSRRSSISGTDRASAAATSAGAALRVPAAELDGEAGDTDVGQRGHIVSERGRRVRQRDPGGKHQLAAAQQPPDVGHL